MAQDSAVKTSKNAEKKRQVLAIIDAFELQSENGNVQCHFSAGVLAKLHITKVI